MANSYVPSDAHELLDVIREANANRINIEIVGGGTKRGMGYPSRETRQLSTSRFATIIDYDPAELVLTVGAGARLDDIESLLASRDQMLAFEPFDFADVSGLGIGQSTIGGVVAAGFSGSRRLTGGSVRDHVLGFTAVSGSGDLFKAGGRVVKNVTGYDLSKLLTGSWGQLAVITELTLKVMPRPRTTVTLMIEGLSDANAMTAIAKAMRSQAMIAAAAYIPNEVSAATSQTLLRLEGFEPSVQARSRLLTSLFGTDLQLQSIDAPKANEIWKRILSVNLADDKTSDAALWRICVPTTATGIVTSGIRAANGRFLVDWAGGLIWASVSTAIEASKIRALAEAAQGHATFVRAPIDYRHSASALHPEASGVAALSMRVRAAFDRNVILDPQRFERRAS